MRATSTRVRQVVLVKDQPIDPFDVLERLQLLNEDGTIVDPTKDATKMRWAGEWDPLTVYLRNDVVRWDNAMWIANGPIAGAEDEPGTTPSLDVGTTKAGDAAFGGHNQPCYILPPSITLSPLPAQLGGEVNVGQPVGGKFYRAEAALGDTITIEWAGGPISIFDGQHGDPLHPNDLPGTSFDVTESPLTFTIEEPDDKLGAAGIGWLTIEANAAVSSLRWFDPAAGEIGTWELIAVGDVGPEGPEGPAGPAGVDGDPGPPGADGADGADGVGVPVGGTDGQVLTKLSATNYDTDWETPSAGGSGGDPSVIIDEDFTGAITDWTADVGSFTQDSGNGYLTPDSVGAILRYNVALFLNVLVAVEFEVLAGFTAGSGLISPQVRRNVAGTHAVHVNLTTAGQGVLYKYHASGFTAVSGANAFNAGANLVAGKRYWGACWAHGYWVGMRGAYHPLAIKRALGCDTIHDLSGDANFNPDAAGRVAIVAEQVQLRIHRVTIYDLTKTRANG